MEKRISDNTNEVFANAQQWGTVVGIYLTMQEGNFNERIICLPFSPKHTSEIRQVWNGAQMDLSGWG